MIIPGELVKIDFDGGTSYNVIGDLRLIYLRGVVNDAYMKSTWLTESLNYFIACLINRLTTKSTEGQ